MTKNDHETAGSSTPAHTPKKTKIWVRPLLHTLGAFAVVGATWATFTYLITDAEMTLSYVQVLAWPTVVIGATYWLRQPLRDKLRQVLKVQAPGLSLDFSLEAQSRELDEGLHVPLANLAPLVAESSKDAPADSDEADDEEPAGQHQMSPTDAVASSAAPSDADPAVKPPHSAGTLEPAAEPVTDAVDPGAAERNARLRDLRAIAMTLGWTAGRTNEIWAREDFDPDKIVQKLQGHIKVQRAIRRRDSATRREQTRESIETVIRNSAAWGYKMGRAGAPQAVPDIEWDNDGNWHITTTVPEGSSQPTAQSLMSATDKQRRVLEEARLVKELEDEIKHIERHAAQSPFPSAGVLSNDKWLAKLKQRLRRVDPSNPWAQP